MILLKFFLPGNHWYWLPLENYVSGGQNGEYSFYFILFFVVLLSTFHFAWSGLVWLGNESEWRVLEMRMKSLPLVMVAGTDNLVRPGWIIDPYSFCLKKRDRQRRGDSLTNQPNCSWDWNPQPSLKYGKHMHACTHAHTHTHMHQCMHIHTHSHAQAYTYTHTHTHRIHLLLWIELFYANLIKIYSEIDTPFWHHEK